MSQYASAPEPEAVSAAVQADRPISVADLCTSIAELEGSGCAGGFLASISAAVAMAVRLRDQARAGVCTADAAEQQVNSSGREIKRLALQGFYDVRAEAERQRRDDRAAAAPVDAAGKAHRRSESGHVRALATTVGIVTVDRVAWRTPGTDNLYPADAELNLPPGLHSFEVAKAAAIASARGSFADAADTLARACGATTAAPAAVRQMTIAAAADFDAFYDHAAPLPSSDGTLLIISADAKGIVVRPPDLRPDTRKKAERDAAAGRLETGDRQHRKRMATIGAVYDAEPAPRRPHDIITLADPPAKKRKKKRKKKDRKKRPGPKAVRKWLTASVADDPADVISRVFDQAEARDPEHRRTWVVLVDGANAQIDAINAEAAKRGVEIHLLIDFIHVLQYLHQAVRVLHPDPEQAADVVAQHALAVLNGRAADVANRLDTQAADRPLNPEDHKKISDSVGYLRNKGDYLGYDTALTKGWPIATGIVEGACRHLIGDRLDITGARWSLPGAGAVLKLRALLANGDFDRYWAWHLGQEHQRNHQARYQLAA